MITKDCDTLVLHVAMFIVLLFSFGFFFKFLSNFIATNDRRYCPVVSWGVVKHDTETWLLQRQQRSPLLFIFFRLARVSLLCPLINICVNKFVTLLLPPLYDVVAPNVSVNMRGYLSRQQLKTFYISYHQSSVCLILRNLWQIQRESWHTIWRCSPILVKYFLTLLLLSNFKGWWNGHHWCGADTLFTGFFRSRTQTFHFQLLLSRTRVRVVSITMKGTFSM